ncbi:NADH dehydrogenase [ubiquinone] 1 alpha subcomplex subunit 7-like isoform X2 [Rhodnius prolixus]|uniref:NADH dehydrogenase [ubiquinone] 1 alpha subcomplex subunit 7-like isoform X2 n=1 Tax=Rhodnius prolixus TaxID=13249 RepID=UPI003D187DEF
MSVEKRLPSGIIKLLRDFLLGRSVPETHRYADEMSSRSPPPPDLPNGPNYRLFDVYYCNRDARREVSPPEQLNPGYENTENKPSAPIPGCIHRWDDHDYKTVG